MKRVAIIMFFMLIGSDKICALIVGSNVTPSRQAVINFPAADSDNEMRGFAVFENGFTLENGSTTCLYNSFFPISGTITLNGGTLLLNHDLKLSSTATLADGGTIEGNSYVLFLPDKKDIFTIPSPITFDAIELNLNSNVMLNATITFDGDCILEGNNYTVDCTSGGISIGTGATLLIKNATLKGIATNNVSCEDAAGTLSLQDVIWIQNLDYAFNQGALNIYNSVIMTGGSVFAYTSSQTSTITTDAKWFFDSGMTFSYDTADPNLFHMINASSQLQLYETTLYASSAGLNVTKGTVILEGKCPVESDAISQSNGINVGDGSLAVNNITLKVLPESGFSLNSGYLVYKNVS